MLLRQDKSNGTKTLQKILSHTKVSDKFSSGAKGSSWQSTCWPRSPPPSSKLSGSASLSYFHSTTEQCTMALQHLLMAKLMRSCVN